MWFGREGRHGVCIVAFSCCVFQIMTANAYIFMYAIHEQFIYDHVNSFISNKKRKKKKKTIKKLVKCLKF